MSQYTEEIARKPPYTYELLGAPILLFRNESTYTPLHNEPFNMDTGSFLDHERRLRRCHARWYYPMDYPTVRPATFQLPDGFLGPIVDDDYRPPSNDRLSEYHCLDIQPSATEDDVNDIESDQGDDIFSIDWALVKKQTIVPQQEARAQLLLSTADAVDDPQKLRQRLHTFRLHQQYDANNLPRKRLATAATKQNSSPATATRPLLLSAKAAKLTKRIDRDRQDFADSAYLAPFDASVVDLLARDDLNLQFPATYVPASAVASDREEQLRHKSTNRENVFYRDMESSDSPVQYGNCLVTAPCPCNVCRAGESPSWCVLHATGALLDQVCCSFLHFPEDEWTNQLAGTNAAVLEIGDSLKQLVECGTDTFIARTMLHCTIFRLSASSSDSSACCQEAQLTLLHRIDVRSFDGVHPSYIPVDVTCHPKYGRGWTDSNVVVLYKDSLRQEQTTLKHLQIGDEARQTSHYIPNLQSVSKIDYSSHHPLVLWSIARSHVSPAMAESQTSTRHPRTGRGYSMYSIDLRSDEGVFQWSPSAAHWRVEGTHSLSGIYTDWNKDHTVWASSMSAGRAWEIDTRMPCRSVCSWSLPFACDDIDAVVSPTGLYGASCLFVQPKQQKGNDGRSFPTLSVSTSPFAFGVHLYQRPCAGPRYQTQNLEAPSDPGVSFLGDASVAVSSSFPLPDVSERVFTCGLAAMELPTSRVLTASKLAQAGYNKTEIDNALCIVTATNKGDLYSHIVLASTASHRSRKSYVDLPVGSASIPLSDSSVEFLASISREVFAGSGKICVSLSSKYPCPSSSTISSSSAYCTVDSPDATVRNINAPNSEQSSDKVRVQASVLNDSVLVMEDLRRNEVHLPQQLADEAYGGFERAYESFDHVSLRNRKREKEENCTDLTDQLVTKSARAWPDMENEDDDQ